MRIGYHRVPSLVLVVLCLVAALPGAAESATACQEQQPQPMTIAVTSPRPLADAIKTLERRHGVVITYEDAPNLSPDLIRDVTEEILALDADPDGTYHFQLSTLYRRLGKRKTKSGSHKRRGARGGGGRGTQSRRE